MSKLDFQARKKLYDSNPKCCGNCSAPILYKNKRDKYCSRECFYASQAKSRALPPLKRNLQCVECGLFFSTKGIGSHTWRKHGKGQGFVSTPKGTREAWNKNLTKELDERVASYAAALSLTFAQKVKDGSYSPPKWTPEARNRLSEEAKRRGWGGHTSKRSVWYQCLDGSIVFLHSSYEEVVAQELDTHKVRWTRPPPFLWVDGSLKEHRYYPDFYLPDFNVYLDPKNPYLIKKDLGKIEAVSLQNKVKLLVLDAQHLTWDRIHALILGSQNFFAPQA